MREELESMLANSDTDNSGHGRAESFSSRRRDRGNNSNNNSSNSLMQYVKYHDSYSDLLAEVGNSLQNVAGGRGRGSPPSRTQSFLCVLFPLLVFAVLVLYVYFAWSGSPDASAVTTTNTLNVPVEASTMLSSTASSALGPEGFIQHALSSTTLETSQHPGQVHQVLSGVFAALWKQAVQQITHHLRVR